MAALANSSLGCRQKKPSHFRSTVEGNLVNPDSRALPDLAMASASGLLRLVAIRSAAARLSKSSSPARNAHTAASSSSSFLASLQSSSTGEINPLLAPPGHRFSGLAASDALQRALGALFAEKVPKGFEKFFKDKVPQKQEESEKATKEDGSKQKDDKKPKAPKQQQMKKKEDFAEFFKRNVGGSGGGGGRSGGSSDSDKQKYATAAVVAAVATALFMGSEYMRYKEITWKEFVNVHLNRGDVEKLTVVNNKWVKVHTKMDPGEQVR